MGSAVNILQIAGNVQDWSANKLDKLLVSPDMKRISTVTYKILEDERTIWEGHETITMALEETNRAPSCVRAAEETLGRARSTLSQDFEGRRADR